MDGPVSDSASIPTAPALITARRLPYSALGASPLFAAYAEGRPAALAYYARDPWSAPDRAEAARRAAAHPRDREALADVLLEQNAAWWGDEEAAVCAHVERLRDPESVVVVTGQQLGLFGGPLYTLCKALAAVRLAAQIEAGTGRPAVPVFWLADEDHDFAEARATTFSNGSELLRVAYDDGRPPEENRGPVGRLPLDDRATEWALAAASAALSATPFGAEVVAALRADWQPDLRWRDAFARTLRRLTAGTGLAFLSADDARLKRLAAPVFRREITDWPETHAALDAVSERLLADGFHAQVAPRPVNLFLFADEGRRLPLDPEGGGFVLRGTSTRFSAGELLSLVEAAPERFSPNVVLRPVMEDALLPTAAYVGGPGEVAYFAQLRPVYERFAVPMPVVYPRAGVTLVPAKLQQHLDRYGLSPADLREDLSALHRRLALERADADLEGAFAAIADRLDALLDALEPVATGVDASLDRAVAAARAKAGKALRRLAEKTVRAEKRRQGVILARLERLAAVLMPGGVPQERVLSAFSFVAAEGMDFPSRLADALAGGEGAEPALDTRTHQVLLLP